jgi:hypothetical protein
VGNFGLWFVFLFGEVPCGGVSVWGGSGRSRLVKPRPPEINAAKVKRTKPRGINSGAYTHNGRPNDAHLLFCKVRLVGNSYFS